MKWMTYKDSEQSKVGYLINGDQIQPVSAADVLEIVRGERWEDVGESITIDRVELLAPLPTPRTLIAIGLNYRDHAEESGVSAPAQPVIFTKFPSSATGTNSTVCIPRGVKQVDYEAELTIVIGKPARNVSVEEALDVVFGYMNGNDISARDLQFLDGKQWTWAKSLDTFAPMGPYLVTKDEISDPQNLSVRCTLNGEVVQDARTSDMIFSVAELIAFLSCGTTLMPGDVIMTGTPSGVGFGRTPQLWMNAGDVVRVEIEGLGILTNQLGNVSNEL